jgi:CRP/FNR family transcriptional regulator, cyclic AMP receptor protein
MIIRKYSQGEIIINEGEYGTEAYFIKSGKVSVLKGDVKVATLNENKLFGEIGALELRPRTATVVATTPLTLQVLTQEETREMTGN